MRLFHQIFLLISLTALIAAVLMAGLSALSLSRGFDAYLDARDQQRLDEFVEEAEALIAARRTPDVRYASALIPDRRPERPPRNDDADQGPPPPGPRGARPLSPSDRSDVGPRKLPPPGFLPRLAVYDSDGTRLAGPPSRPTDMQGTLRKPLMVDSQKVGEVVLLPRGPTPDGIETEFLRDQFIGMALLAIVLVGLSGLAAFVIARRSNAVIEEFQLVARNVASGDFSRRVTVSGKGEVRELADNINQMSETLGELQEARQTWLAEIGHELRTPLTVLQGELEILHVGIRPLDQNAIQSLSEEAGRLSFLIDDLEFLAVSDIAKPTFSFAPCDLAALLGTTQRRFAAQAEAAGLSLEVSGPEPGKAMVEWDAARIEQLLANLVSNSIAYTDAPGLVRLSTKHVGHSIQIAINDSPPGVRDSDLTKLFDPLFRAEKSRDRSLGGSGLGLAVCGAIVDNHNGTIQPGHSQLGGLSILVKLPVSRQDIAMDREPIA